MFPFLAALAQVGGIVVDKITLTRRQVSTHVFVPLLFFFLFLITAILFPFFGQISASILELKYIFIFIFIIITAIVWNIFYYQGVQSEKMHEFELILMMQPLLTILLATIFLKGESNIHIEIAAIAAAVFLIISKLQKAHITLSKGSYKLVLAVVFMSVELILIKVMLAAISPVALYAIRTGLLFILFMVCYRPHFNRVADTNLWLILLTSIFGVTQMIAKFYGFEAYGVVYTSLILILSPILVYFVSTVFLHEKLKVKTVVSAIVILGCIVYATILGK